MNQCVIVQNSFREHTLGYGSDTEVAVEPSNTIFASLYCWQVDANRVYPITIPR